jgi:hypothetical protein
MTVCRAMTERVTSKANERMVRRQGNDNQRDVDLYFTLFILQQISSKMNSTRKAKGISPCCATIIIEVGWMDGFIHQQTLCCACYYGASNSAMCWRYTPNVSEPLTYGLYMDSMADMDSKHQGQEARHGFLGRYDGLLQCTDLSVWAMCSRL